MKVTRIQQMELGAIPLLLMCFDFGTWHGTTLHYLTSAGETKGVNTLIELVSLNRNPNSFDLQLEHSGIVLNKKDNVYKSN